MSVSQSPFVDVGNRFGHSIESIRLAIVLQEDEVGVGHSENCKHENEYKVSDILYHVDQHPDVVACVSEDSKEVEEADPHDDCSKRV